MGKQADPSTWTPSIPCIPVLGLIDGCALDNFLGDALGGWRAARWERLKAKEELSFKLADQEKAHAASVRERPQRANAQGAGAGQRTKRLSASSKPARLSNVRRRRPHDYDAIVIVSRYNHDCISYHDMLMIRS